MKDKVKRKFLIGFIFIVAFTVLTYLIQTVDVKPLGVNGTNIGFSTFNCLLHKFFGVNMCLYTITDWAGLIPIFVAFAFGVLGLVQLIKRRSLIKVDAEIIILGIYYVIVAILYIVFEIIPINYRPILINGFMETSYPSSTTLLVMSVMPTLPHQICRRSKIKALKITASCLTVTFSVFMVVGRLISGVHWFTDILGSALISLGLFYIYKGFVLLFSKKV